MCWPLGTSKGPPGWGCQPSLCQLVDTGKGRWLVVLLLMVPLTPHRVTCHSAQAPLPRAPEDPLHRRAARGHCGQHGAQACSSTHSRRARGSCWPVGLDTGPPGPLQLAGSPSRPI